MKYIKENNILEELVAVFEINCLCKDHNVRMSLEALHLDLIEVSEASEIAWNQLQEALTAITRGILKNDFECIEKNAKTVQSFRDVYPILQAYKSGLEKAIQGGKQIAVERRVSTAY